MKNTTWKLCLITCDYTDHSRQQKAAVLDLIAHEVPLKRAKAVLDDLANHYAAIHAGYFTLMGMQSVTVSCTVLHTLTQAKAVEWLSAHIEEVYDTSVITHFEIAKAIADLEAHRAEDC